MSDRTDEARESGGESISRADSEQLLRLERQLCFVLHATSRAFDTLYRPVLAELGLTYPQYLVMLAVWEHGERSVKELGRSLRLDSGTLSPLLKRLEKAGFVRRERSPADERSVVVRPTEEGIALRERASDIPRRILSATGLDEQQLGELHTALNSVTSALDRAAEEIDRRE
ncbi:MarR family transcriptional regulator [Actinopolyspora erythraea]|uniref:MarR family transcriptional regulator n=1 Tax=Actinopolyspora erythraea TaxID=414996 RepID=A0A099D4P8_9ACTN|nr:MarR family transcriptional regulator [Actinopolyspora erythraea]ASU77470.1 MarR family transcriptional regulator [Actinopolyspora erythraea]KGI80315.1 MarR family transcriptional regulator [Actinopolyspora erythraea]